MSFVLLLVAAQVQFYQGNGTVKVGAPANRVVCGTNVTCSPIGVGGVRVEAAGGSGVGACGANQWVSTLNTNAAPTCTQPAFTNLSGTASIAQGGTGVTTATDDNMLVGNGSTFQLKALPSCSDATTSKLLYNSSTNEFSCGTDQTGGGGGAVTTYAGGVNADIAINSTSNVTLVSKTLTLSAGDTVTIEVWYTTLNNAGNNTYTYNCRIGDSTVLAIAESTTQASNATNRAVRRGFCKFTIASKSSARFWGQFNGGTASAANTAQTGINAGRFGWQVSSSDFTGSQTVGFGIQSSSTGSPQTATVES